MTFLNRPGGFRRRRWRRLGANVGTGFRKRKRQLRARWRPARETPKKPDVLHPASADHQHLSLSRQRPLLATAAECRAGTKLVEFDDRISELASNIDEARRHRDLKLRGWTIERIRADAPGPATAALCELILEQRPHPEQGFRACLGVVRLARPYGAERLEAAAERAIDIGARTYGSVKSILDNHLDRRSAQKRATDGTPILHANIRGPRYYN